MWQRTSRHRYRTLWAGGIVAIFTIGFAFNYIFVNNTYSNKANIMTTNEEHKPFVDRDYLFHQASELIPAKDDVVQPLSINRRRTPNFLTSWTPTKLPKNLQHVHQTDLKLTAHLHDLWILPPFEGPVNIDLDKLPKTRQSNVGSFRTRTTNIG